MRHTKASSVGWRVQCTRALCVFLVLVAVTPVFAARSSAVTAEGTQLSVNVLTSPALLEPGPVALMIEVRHQGEPLRNAPVHIQLASTRKIFLSTLSTTNADGVATIALYLDEPGKPMLTVSALGEEVRAPITVKGRAVLVAGLITSLAVLVVLLLDRP